MLKTKRKRKDYKEEKCDTNKRHDKFENGHKFQKAESAWKRKMV